MELRLEDAKKNTVVNSVKSSGKINDKDNNTEFAINSDQDVVNEFKAIRDSGDDLVGDTIEQID